MASAVRKPANKNLTTDKVVMNESEIDKGGVQAEGEKASRKRAAKAGGAQDVLKLIDVARAAGVKEIAKLRALAKEYAERADAIERKLGSMLEMDSSPKATSTELESSPAAISVSVKQERPAGAESGVVSKAAKASVRSKRSAQDVATGLGRIVDLLKDQPQGLRAGEICEALGLEPKDSQGMIKEGIESHRIQRKGEKRAALYFAK